MEFGWDWLGFALRDVGAIWNTITSIEWTFEKITALVGATFGFVGTLITVIIRWRNSGRRLSKRLTEFLEIEDDRIQSTHAALGELLRYPEPDKEIALSSFNKRPLLSMLRSRKWGWNWRVRSRLERTASTTRQQVGFSQDRKKFYQRELLLSELMLGAMADSERDFTRALGHFEAALDIDPEDMDALEYAGLQLIKIGSAEVALTEDKYLPKLVSEAERHNESGRTMRAYRLCALAYEALPEPNLSRARSALLRATKSIPQSVSPIEVGFLWEQLGTVRQKLRSYGEARISYLEAQNKYSSLPREEGELHLRRVRALLGELRDVQNESGQPIASFDVSDRIATSVVPDNVGTHIEKDDTTEVRS